MSTDHDRLIALAREACASAHAPYSGIHVGAAIRSASGATLHRHERRKRGVSARQLRRGERHRGGRADRGRAVSHRGDGGLGTSTAAGARSRSRPAAAAASASTSSRWTAACKVHFPWQRRKRQDGERRRAPALRVRAAGRACEVTWLPQESIRIKRDGGVLDAGELTRIARGIGDGSLSDAQIGAFAMAVYHRGMSPAECAAFTMAMRDSGEVFDWRAESLPGPVLDKHSTGGVGDLVSLALGPMLAACGAYVPMIVGRGLAHTGGTLDKLESIPGYQSRPPPDRVRRAVREAGVAIVGAGDRIAPADRRLYSIRDVTATVDCLPLIVASILSKKLAAGLQGLVLDIKRGNGAVLPEPERGRELATGDDDDGRRRGPAGPRALDRHVRAARALGRQCARGPRGDRAASRRDARRAAARGHAGSGAGSAAARQAREGREVGAFVPGSLDHERHRGGAVRADGRRASAGPPTSWKGPARTSRRRRSSRTCPPTGTASSPRSTRAPSDSRS